jgi:uncharacterized RDD family membrane protein YckC
VDDRSPADDHPGGPTPSPCRVSVHHLTPHQVELLRTVLRAGDVPFGIVRGEVVAAAEFTDEVEKAVAWAGVDPTDDEAFADPDHRPVRAPLVKPPRPPLRDGRRQATRWRRLSAGLLDELIVGVPTVLAAEAGAPAWTSVTLHAVYHVAPTMLYGWTIGKLWTGVRVTHRASLRTPGALRSGCRWVVAAVPMFASVVAGAPAGLVSVLVAAVYGPILVDLRGLHDYAADTLVVERTKAGPGVWVRSARRDGLRL